MKRLVLCFIVGLFVVTGRLDAKAGDPVLAESHTPGEVIRALAFSPDGRRVLSAEGKVLFLWQHGVLFRRFEGHKDTIEAVAFSGDGELAASGSADGETRVWDIRSGNLLASFKRNGPRIFVGICAVRFVLNSDRVLAITSLEASLFSLSAQTPLQEEQSALHCSAALSANGGYAANGTENGFYSDTSGIALWATTALGKRPNMVQGLDPQKGAVRALAISNDHRTIVSSDAGYRVHVWDGQSSIWTRWVHFLTRRSDFVIDLSGHRGFVVSLALSDDNRTIASGSLDHTTRLWDTGTGALLHILEGHTGSIRAVAFSPNGKCLVTGGDDSVLQYWDVQGGSLILSTRTDEAKSEPMLSPERNKDQVDADGAADATKRTDHVTALCLSISSIVRKD